jgi:hypothetical protein
MTSDLPASASDRQRCRGTRRDGRPCTATAGRDGLCVGHRPEAQEARRRGGRASSKTARLARLMPPRLASVYDLLEEALERVYRGEVSPRVAAAMGSLASAMVRVLTAGELEDRVRRLEAAQEPRDEGGGR